MKFFKYILVIAIVFSSCKGKESTDESNVSEVTDEQQNEVVIKSQEAVCITDKVGVRKEPMKSGKWLSRLNLGEKVVYLGESHVDTTVSDGYEYHFVELSDGTRAWAYAYGVLIDAKPAAIVNMTAVYSRPDLVNKTADTFNKMDFVAIVGEKDQWLEVVGAGKKKSGWIPKKKVSMNAEDVAVASLAYKSILDKKGEIKVEAIASFLEELPYDNNQFKTYLQKILDESVENVIEQSLEEYEAVGEELVEEVIDELID